MCGVPFIQKSGMVGSTIAKVHCHIVASSTTVDCNRESGRVAQLTRSISCHFEFCGLASFQLLIPLYNYNKSVFLQPAVNLFLRPVTEQN